MGKRLSDPGDAMWIAGTENWTQEARDALLTGIDIKALRKLTTPSEEAIAEFAALKEEEEKDDEKRDDPGLAKIKRMEAMMGKAPCLARLDDLAAWSAKDAD